MEHNIANESKEEQIKALEATFKKLGWHKDKDISRLPSSFKLSEGEFILFVIRLDLSYRVDESDKFFDTESHPAEGNLIGTSTRITLCIGDKQHDIASRTKRILWDGKAIKIILSRPIIFQDGLFEYKVRSPSFDMERASGKKAEVAGVAVAELFRLVNPSVDVVRQDRCAICGRKIGLSSPSEEIHGRRFCSSECITQYWGSEEARKGEQEFPRARARMKKVQQKQKEARAKEKALREEEQRKEQEHKQALMEEEQRLRDKVASEPSDPIAYFELGQLLSEQKSDLKQAREHYTKALALGLSDPIQKGIAHHDLGCDCNCYYGDHDHRWFPNITSREAFPRSYPYKPTPEQVYHLEEAVKEFNIALKSNPEDIQTVERLAHIYGALGKKREQGKMLALVEEIKVRKSLQAAPPLATKKDIQDKTGLSFEEKCLKLLEKLGFTCRRTAITGDGGIDIIATSNQPLFSGTYIVQCKNWKNLVGEPPVRDLYGVVASENANKGILVTSSTFTEAAQNFAQGKNIELIDGDQLEQLIQKYLAEDVS